jgi:DNA repair protein RadA/Sms
VGSATKGMQLAGNYVVFGEVGLLGEVRHVPYAEKRLSEAKKLGFDGAIGPKAKGMSTSLSKLLKPTPDVRGALNQFLEGNK